MNFIIIPWGFFFRNKLARKGLQGTSWQNKLAGTSTVTKETIISECLFIYLL